MKSNSKRTSLTFFGGAGEIGGNKFLLQTPLSKIYLDFGESFGSGEDYFYEYLEWLTHFGITLHKAHCSGHAGKSDLKYAVRKSVSLPRLLKSSFRSLRIRTHRCCPSH